MSQQNQTPRPHGHVTIYACGGGGANIGQMFDDVPQAADVSRISVAYIDTSDSNLDEQYMERAYLFRGLDGSGKDKELNETEIVKALPDVIKKFPPGDLSIVVFTLGGGSGSTTGQNLMKQLVAQGHSVVGITIASYQDEKAVSNTISTIKTLSKFAREIDKPLVTWIGTNTPEIPRSKLDKQAATVITGLCILASRRNRGLDRADIRSMLVFNEVTDIPAQLARLHIFESTEDFDKGLKNPISAAFLKRNIDDPDPTLFAAHSSEGFLPNTAQTSSNLFFGIENESLHELSEMLRRKKADLQLAKTTRRAAPSFDDDDDETTATGGVR